MNADKHLSVVTLAVMVTTICLSCGIVARWADTRWMDVVSSAFLLGCAISNSVIAFHVWRARRVMRAGDAERGRTSEEG